MSTKPSALPTAAEYRALTAKRKVISFTRVSRHSPETLVRYFGQVDLLNKIAGNPRPNYSFLPSSTGGSVTRAVAGKGGVTLSYDELPYEWSMPLWARAENFSDAGPLAYVLIEYALERIPEGTLVTFRGGRVSRGSGLLGYLIGRKFMKSAEKAVDIVERSALPAVQDPLNIGPYTDTEKATGVDRASLLRRMSALHSNAAVAERVADFIATAPEKLVARLRPLQVAAHYGLPERDSIEFFLRATRAGIFNLSWDLLCPTCRGDKARFGALATLETEAHCDYCNISYDADFTSNIELTFRPAPSVRKLLEGSFCINSPGNTAFVHAQFNVWPDAPMGTAVVFPEERYRLRSLQFSGVREVVISDDVPSRAVINLASELDGQSKDGPLRLSKLSELEFVNDGDSLVTVKFYRDAYRDNALTAARVTSMQEFRDQFGAEALSPGLQVGIENLCFLFTDLKDSTPMYERLGDASAFALVRDHFAILIDEVRACDGGVVKTIGDAVMAVFCSTTDAIRAAARIQRRIHAEHPAVSVKVGLHAGPCIAVNSNDKLDYFGTTVNRAARIQGLADGRDIVMSAELEGAAEESERAGFQRSEFQATLKGIAGDTRLVRWHLT